MLHSRMSMRSSTGARVPVIDTVDDPWLLTIQIGQRTEPMPCLGMRLWLDIIYINVII